MYRNLNFLITAMILWSLAVQSQRIKVASNVTFGKKTEVVNCSFFTKDAIGNIVLCYGKEAENKETIFCYSVFDAHKKEFQTPIEVSSSKGVELHGENAPKMAFKSNGDIIAVWGIDNPTPAKKYGGLVMYSQSFDKGKTWTPAVKLVADEKGIDQRYFDIDLLPNGEVAIIWLDNRTKTDLDGSTLFYAETTERNGFTNERAIGETTCQCCRTDLLVSVEGVIYASYRDIIDGEIRDMVLSRSLDNGVAFLNPVRISPDDWKIKGCPHTGPTMVQNELGLHFAWFTMGGAAGVFYSNSFDNGQSFAKREIVSVNTSAKHPQIGVLNGNDVIVVWDESQEVNGIFFGRVGLQLRAKNGKVKETQFVSPMNASASFPVIRAVNKNEILVAWTEKEEGEKEKINCAVVTIKP